MITYRTVSGVLFARPFDMDGLPIRQPFPNHELRQIDPFILLHHAKVSIAPGTDLAEAGVGPHPHKGFSPVSFIFRGGVHHRDSKGNDSTIYAGGTQWMNAGRGIQHSERPPENIFELGAEQELIQLWVNSPEAHKEDEPVYYPLTAEDTPVYRTADGKGELHLQAGQLMGLIGPIPALIPINAATLYLQPGAAMEIPLPKEHNAFLYILEGELEIQGSGNVQELHAAVFANDGEAISFTAMKDTKALLMSGTPIGEALVSYGPFVMNSQEGIRKAIVEYQMGLYGEVVED